MGTIERIRGAEGWTSAFANGFSDGQAARDRNQALSAYVRVGIDDYARGYRQGFYDRAASTSHTKRQPSRPLTRL